MIFRFKQFEVKHSESLLKVNTDAVLLGALMHSEIEIKTALDIGTGCGIIALMNAQKFTNAKTDALEIDLPSCEEAEYNFTRSPFADRLNAFPIALQKFESEKRYDLIFSNPPYYETPDFSKGNNKQYIKLSRKKTATQFLLTFDELIFNCCRLMHPESKLWVIIPQFSSDNFQVIANNSKLYLIEEILIRSKDRSPVIRCVLCLSFNEILPVKSRDLIIYNEDGSRHSDYVTITNEYYL